MAYSKAVEDHFANPRNVGKLDKDDPNVGTGIVGAPACLHPNTLIPVADGRGLLTIKELADIGEDVPIYSYDEDRGIIIAYGRRPRLTKTNVELIKITLDDGSSIICTPDHLFRTRARKNNKWVAAEELKIGQSLMPFTRLIRRKYWTVHSNLLQNSRQPEHRLISEFFNGPIKNGYQVHHINHNKLDNNPINLEAISAEEHIHKHHIDNSGAYTIEANKKKSLPGNIAGDKNPMRKWWSTATEQEKNEYHLRMSIATSGEFNGMYGKTHTDHSRLKMSENRRSIDYVETYKKICAVFETETIEQREMSKRLQISQFIIAQVIRKIGGYSGYIEFVKQYNHKVILIEKVIDKSDVYCMTVEGTQNFAVVTKNSLKYHTGIIVHNCGDVLKLQIKVDKNGIIEDVKFKGFGCGSLISSSSLATELIKMLSLDNAEIKADNINEEIYKNLSLPPIKAHCSLLAREGIVAAIADYRKKQETLKQQEALKNGKL